MSLNLELIITVAAAITSLLVLVFAVDWRYFRDWVVIFLYKGLLDCQWVPIVVESNLIEFPVRLLGRYYNSSLLFELWVLPILCIWYNHVTRESGIRPILFYGLLFSAGITAVEYPIELYTDLIHYIDWTWFDSFYTLLATFLSSRVFIAFYRWGCSYFGK